MTLQPSRLVLCLTLTAVLAAPLAEAARLGKGKSSGMQRSTPTQSYNQQTPAAKPQPLAPAPMAPQTARPASSGPGVGGMVAAGVAGAAAGYMLSEALSDDEKAAADTAAKTAEGAANSAATAATTAAPAAAAATPAPAPTEEGGGFPWGGLILLMLLGGAVMMFMKKKKTASPLSERPLGGGLAPAGGVPYGQDMQRNQTPGSSLFNNTPYAQGGGGMSAASNFASGRLPDGTEVPHFLRQAKATFLHVQSMNNPANLDEIRKYLTPQLFDALRADISDNMEPADFPTLNCDFLNAEQENGGYVASVRFHGMVSESVNAPLMPFSETWHYIKSAQTDNKWIVAGIQQG